MNMLLTSGASSESSLASPLIPMVGLLVGKNEAPCELAKPAGLHFLSVVIVSFASCSHIMAFFAGVLDSDRTIEHRNSRHEHRDLRAELVD